MKKYYIWGFPGIGKSSVNFKPRIIDADCERFKFVIPEDIPDDPHSQQSTAYTQRDPSYPNNYLDYIHSVDADMVLLNCHISLLKTLDRKRLLLVYPSAALKEEYLRRYTLRGDDQTYIRYMETAFEEMAAAVRNSPYRKYEINSPCVYLQNHIERGVIMEQFITKKELANLLSECIQVGVYTQEGPAIEKTPDELAQMLFDGELSLDIAALKHDLADKKAHLEEERLLNERRGGLSHGELSGKIMEGIVNGALNIRHGEAAPYSFGYEVSFRSADATAAYGWTCFCSLPDVAEQITQQIEKAAPQVDIDLLLSGIDLAERNKITIFVPEAGSGLERRGQYTGHVANVRDVHRGIALDGIILGHFQGDYSSITTGTENNTVRAMVALKGFCLDCVHRLPSRPLTEFVIGYLKDHGTDISTPEKLNAWIRANPDKCALPENRGRVASHSEAGRTALEKGENTGKRRQKKHHDRGGR